MNVVVLTGRLVKEPETRTTNNGLMIAKFTLADNSKKDEPNFINCVAFGKTAEIVDKYGSKGKMLGVTGRVQTGSYEKNGERRYTTEIVTDRVELFGKEEKPKTEQATMEGFEVLEEELPF